MLEKYFWHDRKDKAILVGIGFGIALLYALLVNRSPLFIVSLTFAAVFLREGMTSRLRKDGYATGFFAVAAFYLLLTGYL